MSCRGSDRGVGLPHAGGRSSYVVLPLFALAGIGFTMSLLIAGEAFANPTDFAAAKIAVFAASILAAIVGTGSLWREGSRQLSSHRE